MNDFRKRHLSNLVRKEIQNHALMNLNRLTHKILIMNSIEYMMIPSFQYFDATEKDK